MREGAFWAVGAGVALVVTCVLPLLRGEGIMAGDHLAFVASMFLAPSAVGACICVLTRNLLPWGTWALTVPCVLGTGAVFGRILQGSSVWGPMLYMTYSTIPFVLFVPLLRLSWALDTRLPAGVCAASRAARPSSDEDSPVLREGTGVMEFPPGIRSASRRIRGTSCGICGRTADRA
ncbi:hypothetical protein [Brevibacterium album]|uniref:hypothetical protein n=1 Tax=Brevibacterium album TaxID=417948 RepID=UPI000490832C|nr:hypothetical protein [Brevibacterium album]